MWIVILTSATVILVVAGEVYDSWYHKQMLASFARVPPKQGYRPAGEITDDTAEEYW
jgi:hypothetical protein